MDVHLFFALIFSRFSAQHLISLGDKIHLTFPLLKDPNPFTTKENEALRYTEKIFKQQTDTTVELFGAVFTERMVFTTQICPSNATNIAMVKRDIV
jgi:hypothetical protein